MAFCGLSPTFYTVPLPGWVLASREHYSYPKTSTGPPVNIVMTTTLFPQRAAQYFLTLPTSGFFLNINSSSTCCTSDVCLMGHMLLNHLALSLLDNGN